MPETRTTYNTDAANLIAVSIPDLDADIAALDEICRWQPTEPAPVVEPVLSAPLPTEIVYGELLNVKCRITLLQAEIREVQACANRYKEEYEQESTGFARLLGTRTEELNCLKLVRQHWENMLI